MCITSKDVTRVGAERRRPSIFDIGLYLFTFLAPVFFLLPWDLNMIQGIFFVFGVFTLLGLSFLSLPQREFRSRILGLIIIWSLINVFIHSFNHSLSSSYAAKFINYCLLSEGFIYILCGSLLFYLVSKYSKNFNIAYPILLINVLNLAFAFTQKLGIHWIWINNPSISGVLGQCTQFSLFSALSIPILASLNIWLVLIPLACLFLYSSFTSILTLMIVGILYCAYKRKNLFGLGILAVYCFFNYGVLLSKLNVRAEVWLYSLKEIISKPLFGLGFDHSLNFNMIPSSVGLSYRHNDFLNITRDQGVPFLLVILFGLYLVLKRSKKDYIYWSILIIIISSLFQTNLYFSRIASVAIVLLAIKESQCRIY